jgi:peptidoglycan/LPS O-acetylase OafA/YrhL
MQKLLPFRRDTALAMLAVMLAFTLGYYLIPENLALPVGNAAIPRIALYIAVLLVFMPYIFEALMDDRVDWLSWFDRMLGELSYPLYIMHSVVLFRMLFLKRFDPLLSSLIMAVLTYVLIVYPIEKHLRTRIARRWYPESAAARP